MSENNSDAEKSQQAPKRVFLDLNFASWESMTPEQKDNFAARLHAAITSELSDEDESESK